jgi:multidrug efflux pump subunit AcrA (membrane-fusion protein)
MNESFFARFKNKYVISGAVLAIIIIAIIIAKNSNKALPFQFTTANMGTVQEIVSVTGTVSPVGQATLAFEKGGVISAIYVKVSDKISQGQAIASLTSADDQAALDSANASLADMSRTLTPEELAVQKTAVANAESDAVNAAHDGYVKALGAVVNYADQFFNNAQSVNPSINVYTQSMQAQISLNGERVAVSDSLKAWSNELTIGTTGSSASALISKSQSHLLVIKSFMSDLSNVVNSLNTGNSGLSQSAINADVATINLALSNLDTAVASVSGAQTALATALSNYNLKLSGNSSEFIAVQVAKVAQAQAILDQDTIHSPINGVVTLVSPNVGEFVSPGQAVFGVQSDGNYKIEANVPEADIAKVAVGDIGTTTLDAYGSNTFFGVKVETIDPAPVVIEGVPTYKVTSYFTNPDSRIRSGMTANLEILTHERQNVLKIPYRAVSISATSTTVRIVNGDGKTYKTVPIVTGLKGSDGTIEIVSGLNAGDKVVTYITS